MSKSAKNQTQKEKIGVVRFWTWNARSASAAVQAIIIGYISFYCTDVHQLNPAIVATLLMATKLVDSVTDILAGYLIDITKTRFGKARPYELGVLGLWLCTWLLFSVPADMANVYKYVWVAVFYTLSQSVFYTVLTANETAYMVRAFNNQEHYVTISSLGGLITVAGVAVFNVVFPSFAENAGTNAGAWSLMVAVLAVPLAVIGMLRFFFVKEIYSVDTKGERVRFTDVITLFKTNKYIWSIALLLFVSNLATGMGASVYYYTYVIGNLSLMGTVSLFSVVTMFTMALYPVLLKKITTKQLIMVGCFAYIIGGIIFFLTQSGFAFLAVATILTGMGSLPITMMVKLLQVECADYNEWKGNQRMEGSIGSLSGFAIKVGAAFGTFLAGILLAVSGYVGGTDVLPDSALLMIRMLMGIVPSLGFVLDIFVLHFFYDLDKKIVDIRAELEKRRSGNPSETV